MHLLRVEGPLNVLHLIWGNMVLYRHTHRLKCLECLTITSTHLKGALSERRINNLLRIKSLWASVSIYVVIIAWTSCFNSQTDDLIGRNASSEVVTLINIWSVFCNSKILMWQTDTHTHTRGRFMLGRGRRWYPVQCSWCTASRQPCAMGGKPGLILVQGKPGLSHSCFSIGMNVFVTAWETDINICLHVCIWRKRPWNNDV